MWQEKTIQNGQNLTSKRHREYRMPTINSTTIMGLGIH